MLMAVALSVPFMSLVSVCPHALTGLHLFHSLLLPDGAFIGTRNAEC